MLSGVGALIFSVVAGGFMLGPLLPDMAQDLGTSIPLLAQLVTFSAVPWSATGLLVGPLSDIYGRRPLLLLGAALAGAGALGTALSDSFAVLAGFRILVGIGSGMIPPTAMALIGDTLPQENKARATGVFVAMPGAANLVGIPLLAVLGDIMGWRTSFVAVGLFMLLSGAAFFVLSPRLPGIRSGSVGYTVRLRRALSSRLSLYLLAMAILLQGVYGTLLIFFPPFLREVYGLTASQVALPVSIFAVGTIVGGLVGGRVAGHRNRLNRSATILLGILAFALATFLLEAGLWPSVAMAAILMLGMRIAFTVMLTLGNDAGGQSRGTLMGLLVAGNQGGIIVGMSLGGLLVAQWGYGRLGFMCGAAVIGASALFRFALTEKAISLSDEYFSETATTGK